MTSFWVSFWACNLSRFEYHGPWWVTGERDLDDMSEYSVVMAVRARDRKHALRIARGAWDPGHSFGELRLVKEMPEDWNPLANESGRFPPNDWMRWPWPQEETAT